jgi:alpha-1,3-mannosyltransferase
VVYLQAGGIPNWVILLLPLSKRLHSIYVLRLFNDCWAAVAVQAAIWAYGRDRGEFLGTILYRRVHYITKITLAHTTYSAALSIKMSVLLYLPGLLVILVKKHGILEAARHVAVIVLLQLFFGAPFLLQNTQAYLAGAFDLSREFLYKWTVNWRFLPEQVFLNKGFAATLLVLHMATLIAFGTFRWSRRDGGLQPLLRRAFRRPDLSPAAVPVTADCMLCPRIIATSLSRMIQMSQQ